MEAAAKLIKVFDIDRNGCIDFSEYATLHQFLNTVRNAFLIADADKSQRLDAKEIHSALRSIGFPYLTPSTIMELINRYDRSRAGLMWEEFLMLAAHVAHCRSIFDWNDKDKDGWITINQDQLIQLTTYLS
eukprot:TRINITY_DN3427_c0_g1_i3.p1 TRINITY_DN3427_c0_g1~~TRINITY_DN3427_c0_g1_i3.p1  ORF type:complete len:131 (-),score=16.16 TRINITY_DN3427_c0_g1_i3:84-476(-)